MANDLTISNAAIILSPGEVVEGATIQAKLLMDIVEKTHCFQVIKDKKYLQVEAWETIGAFNRTHAETESITPILRDNETIGYQAHVQLWKDGVIVGGAIMPCYFTENCCKGKEGDAKHKACMSAAQTFATSKAYRMNFSYVAILAGYQPLPAEEVTEDMKEDKTEHWCEEHNTNFFMKGRMKSFAHPIGDTGEWCHEHKEEKPVAQVETKQAPIDKVTEAQRKKIISDSEKMGYRAEDMIKIMNEAWGINASKDLNKKQASALIDFIASGKGTSEIDELKAAAI